MQEQIIEVMLQHDESGDRCATLTRCRPLDDTDASSLANTPKRQCLDNTTKEKCEDDRSEDKKYRMDTSMDEIPVVTNEFSCAPMTTLSPDEILIQMVQSGCYTQEEVVNFCISSGIPLSRMLRLDLMRLNSNTHR